HRRPDPADRLFLCWSRFLRRLLRPVALQRTHRAQARRRSARIGTRNMHMLDSHFHYWPRSFFEQLCSREGYPKAFRNPDGGYDYRRKEGALGLLNLEPEWFDLDSELAHMDSLGHRIDVIGSIGPLSIHFSDVPLEQGIEDARHWNEAMAVAQRTHPG